MTTKLISLQQNNNKNIKIPCFVAMGMAIFVIIINIHSSPIKHNWHDIVIGWRDARLGWNTVVESV